jgi:hypothetical protein
MPRPCALLLMTLLASPAPAETVWLRGRGNHVWIEVDGRVQEPQKNRKGFTRVSSPSPAMLRNRVRPSTERRRHGPVVVHLDAPAWSQPSSGYDDGYDHRPPRYRHRGYFRHSRSVHRSHHGYGRHRHGLHHGQRRGGHVRDGRPARVGRPFVARRGARVVRGGVHRRR